MFVVTRSPKIALISLAVSVGIFLILYFTVIKSDQNTANNAIRQGEQTALKAVKQASQNGAAIPAGVTNLTSCLAAAGADTSKIQACSAKFKP